MYFKQWFNTRYSYVRILSLMLMGLLLYTPVMEALAHTETNESVKYEDVVILDEIVGETIDLEERNRYGLFLFSHGFRSARIIKRFDGTYAARIVEGVGENQSIRILPLDQSAINLMRSHIRGFDTLHPAVRDSISSLHELLPNENEFAPCKSPIQQSHSIYAAQERAKELAKLHWTKERWREERSHDRGGSYTVAGSVLGCTLGAAAGMLIGKGFQGKKVARTEYHHHSSEWGSSSWTEEFYSYDHKHAPHWGAAVGAFCGTILGNILGRKADKQYYILVPRHIRETETQSTWFGNFFLGFVIMGPAMFYITGKTFATPDSGRAGESAFDGSAGLLVYLLGSILTTSAFSALGNRTKHTQLWQKSFYERNEKVSTSFQLIPLDEATFCLGFKQSPLGDTYCTYQMNLARIRF